MGQRCENEGKGQRDGEIGWWGLGGTPGREEVWCSLQLRGWLESQRSVFFPQTNYFSVIFFQKN